MEAGHPLATIAALWRYPVKSLAAEPLASARVGPNGFEGDRLRALFITDANHARHGKPLRGKEHRLLHTLDGDARAVEMADRDGVAVESRGGGPYYDKGDVSLLFDCWLDEAEALTAMHLDPLRFRPNIFARIRGPHPGSEADFVGARLRAGSVVLRVDSPIVRCVTPTYDIVSGESSPPVLRTLVESRGAHMGVYCTVETPGTLAAGVVIERLA
ncbi:MAG: MOSC domain-containing protein [Candidatus Eremiobacteraeota bacterium]|nr:MOSC domain-containing protein [Candidatus Eremiobacteraeota bacterium]